MYDRTYYATHPDMMECVSNEELRDRYLIQGLFRAGECVTLQGSASLHAEAGSDLLFAYPGETRL